MTEIPPEAGPVDRVVTGSRVREWEVIRFVARGAFGQVFEARRDSWVADEPARALKVFDPILSSAARAGLLEEFGVLRSMRHPHLVAGHDAFDLVDGPLRGCVVFVMELASTDLASLVARDGPLPAREVASIGAQLAAGLAALHGADRLHGDVKPENVLSVDGRWKLGDFGVVSTLQGSYANPVGATLDFRPPELSSPDGGARVHRSADVWALGVTLWWAATGDHPFVGSDPQLRHAAVLRGDRRPRPEIDPSLADLLEARCLAADPRDRTNAADLARALAALAGQSIELLPAEVTAAAPGAADVRRRASELETAAEPATEPTPAATASIEPTGKDRRSQRASRVWGSPVAALLASVVLTSILVQAASWIAASSPGGLTVRRGIYLVLVSVWMVGAWVLNRRGAWISPSALRWAAVGSGAVVLVTTAYLFGAFG